MTHAEIAAIILGALGLLVEAARVRAEASLEQRVRDLEVRVAVVESEARRG